MSDALHRVLRGCESTGHRLRVAFAARQLTAERVALGARIATARLSRAMRDYETLTPTQEQAIADVLQIPVRVLFPTSAGRAA